MLMAKIYLQIGAFVITPIDFRGNNVVTGICEYAALQLKVFEASGAYMRHSLPRSFKITGQLGPGMKK
jgi:hypothetical protein